MNVEEALKAIEINERARTLWEILLETIGCSYENTQKEVFLRLKEIQEQGNEAMNLLQPMRQPPKGKKPNKKGGVSDSN